MNLKLLIYLQSKIFTVLHKIFAYEAFLSTTTKINLFQRGLNHSEMSRLVTSSNVTVQHFIVGTWVKLHSSVRYIVGNLLYLGTVQWSYSSLYKSKSASNASTVTVSVPISESLSMSYTVVNGHKIKMLLNWLFFLLKMFL